MPRPKKDYKTLNVKLASDVADKFDNYIDTTELTKTRAVEKILSAYLENWDTERKKIKKDIL